MILSDEPMKQIIAVLLCSFLFLACGKRNERVQPEYRTVTEAVYATGILMPADEYKVYAQQDGIITTLYVNEGDSILRGQALCVLENDVQNARLQSSRQTLSVAESNVSSHSTVLREMESSIENAKTRLNDDSVTFARYTRLLKENAVSSSEYDKAALKFRLSKKDYEITRQRYEQTRERLKVELENARTQRTIAEKDNKNVTLLSAIDGMVYELYKEKGELVKKNDAVALLGSRNNLYAKLLIDEIDIGRIAVGQEVAISIDSYNGKVFKAKVVKIYPMLNRQDQTVRIDAEFMEMPPLGMAALTVEGNIIVRSTKNALTIPRTFLKGKDSIIIENGSDEKTIKVVVGAQNYDFVEIVSGIDKSTTVIKP